MKLLQQRLWIRWGAMVVLVFAQVVHAEKPSDAAALSGIESGKVVWDVTVGTPSKLSLYLSVIEETYDDLERQGVPPDMIFTFHGPVVKLLSTNPPELPLDEELALEKVHEQIEALRKRPGVRMEACSVAARLLGVELDHIMPAVTPVGNTFVSLIGYQQKGYAMIPIE